MSTPWPMRMIETPVSASPARIERWMGAAPRQRGRSEACTFTHPAGAIVSTSSGRMQPKVAATAPGSPATRMPTKVAELMAMGPGVI